VLHAILNEVERIRPEESGSLDDMRDRMLTAGAAADDGMTLNLKQKVRDDGALRAMVEERDSFIKYIRSLGAGDLYSVEALPHRYVLPEGEARALSGAIHARWEIQDSHWFPFTDAPVRKDALAFHTDLFRVQRKGTALLRKFLGSQAITYVLEIPMEDTDPPSDPACEIELGLFDPLYLMREACWTSRDLEWLVYASHESSITIAGNWLISAFKAEWPDWKDVQYGGPYSTPDLRGTWKWEDK
jgi:hypothetical protein